jgi:hypothetical protein
MTTSIRDRRSARDEGLMESMLNSPLDRRRVFASCTLTFPECMCILFNIAAETALLDVVAVAAVIGGRSGMKKLVFITMASLDSGLWCR